MKIALQEVQENINDIANRHEYSADIIYELLAAYGRSKSAITQLREGHLNKAEDNNAVLQKDVVYFKTFAIDTPLEAQVEELYEDPLTQRYNPRYLIATDLNNLAAKDNLKGTTLTIKLADIDDHLDFFYGWTGDEVVDTKTEAVADRRAADKMNELYVEIEKQNRTEFAANPKFRHELNVFFTRLLFCYFAEDTGIYNDKQFTNAIKSYTQTDGSDLAWFFGELFSALDTNPEENHTLKTPFKEFPYVNGSIFSTVKHAIAIPKFSAQARHLILECGRQNWGEINPDIFGTIFQGVVDPEHRDENGMDYTSVPNIMKVIKPLFLDGLHEDFDKYYDNERKLWALLARVQKIKVFDPACGSGNFLIIAYKELRQLQHAIIGQIDELMPSGIGIKIPDNQLLNINNFYGIEIDDFAHELAVLSLFLAKHQMNQEFAQQFGKSLSIIPLIDIPTIVRGNAALLDWQEVCTNVGHTVTAAEQSALFELEGKQAELKLVDTTYDEIYLIGNPPYLGQRNQKDQHKQDLALVFDNDKSGKYKKMDYVCIWFMKGAEYIKGTSARLSFVSTNSVTQGVQIEQLWPRLFAANVDIKYAYRPFKWTNSARDVSGVFCVVISLGDTSQRIDKYIFEGSLRAAAQNINPYLIDADNVIVEKAKYQLSNFHKMLGGCQPREGGYLMLDNEEKVRLIEQDSRAEKYILPMVGSNEFLKDQPKWCIWIEDRQLDEVNQIPILNERVNQVRQHRLHGNSVERTFANVPWKFVTTRRPVNNQIIIPAVTTSSREYIPIGLLDRATIVNSRAYCLFDAELFYFSILSSSMHNTWVKTVSGRLGDAINYSSNICYNTFPLRSITESEKEKLNKSARRILLARAAHPEKTLADMYDPNKMPADLREAHNENDHLVDSLYKKGGFTNDEDRLAALFDLYEQMIAKEKAK